MSLADENRALSPKRKWVRTRLCTRVYRVSLKKAYRGPKDLWTQGVEVYFKRTAVSLGETRRETGNVNGKCVSSRCTDSIESEAIQVVYISSRTLTKLGKSLGLAELLLKRRICRNRTLITQNTGMASLLNCRILTVAGRQYRAISDPPVVDSSAFPSSRQEYAAGSSTQVSREHSPNGRGADELPGIGDQPEREHRLEVDNAVRINFTCSVHSFGELKVEI